MDPPTPPPTEKKIDPTLINTSGVVIRTSGNSSQSSNQSSNNSSHSSHSHNSSISSLSKSSLPSLLSSVSSKKSANDSRGSKKNNSPDKMKLQLPVNSASLLPPEQQEHQLLLGQLTWPQQQQARIRGRRQSITNANENEDANAIAAAASLLFPPPSFEPHEDIEEFGSPTDPFDPPPTTTTASNETNNYYPFSESSSLQDFTNNIRHAIEVLSRRKEEGAAATGSNDDTNPTLLLSESMMTCDFPPFPNSNNNTVALDNKSSITLKATAPAATAHNHHNDAENEADENQETTTTDPILSRIVMPTFPDPSSLSSSTTALANRSSSSDMNDAVWWNIDNVQTATSRGEEASSNNDSTPSNDPIRGSAATTSAAADKMMIKTATTTDGHNLSTTTSIQEQLWAAMTEVLNAFSRLEQSLAVLMDELELVHTFRNNKQTNNMNDQEVVLKRFLVHASTLSHLFQNEIMPWMEEQKDDDNRGEVTLWENIAFLVDMLGEVSSKVGRRQEWTNKSETSCVTLLEMVILILGKIKKNGDDYFRDSSFVLPNIEQAGQHPTINGETLVYHKPSIVLQHAWKKSGHAKLLSCLVSLAEEQTKNTEQTCNDDDNEQDAYGRLFLFQAYRVLLTCDAWCPTNLMALQDICNISSLLEHTSSSSIGIWSVGKKGKNTTRTVSTRSLLQDNNDSDKFPEGPMARIPVAAQKLTKDVVVPPNVLLRSPTVECLLRRLLLLVVMPSLTASLTTFCTEDIVHQKELSSGESTAVTGTSNCSKDNSATREASSVMAPFDNNWISITSISEDPSDPESLGMAGIGKTILAAIVVKRVEIRLAFRGGIVWLNLGHNRQLVPGSFHGEMTYDMYVRACREILRQTTGLAKDEDTFLFPAFTPGLFDSMAHRREKERQAMYTVKTNVQEKLMNSLKKRKMSVGNIDDDVTPCQQHQQRILIVLDDVTEAGDIEWFSSFGALLITTRIRDMLPAADTVEVDLLEDTEALQLLAAESGLGEKLPTSRQARDLVTACAYHPLAVKFVGRWLRMKHASAGVINSVAELSEDMLHSIEAILEKDLCQSNNMMYEILGHALLPMLPNGKKTEVLRISLAAYVAVFCDARDELVCIDPTFHGASPEIPQEAADILFSEMLQNRELIEDEDEDVLNADPAKAQVLIREALTALGFLRPEGNYFQIPHEIPQEYGEFLVMPEAGLQRLVRFPDWNQAFVVGYFKNKGKGVRDCWDNGAKEDVCCRYALKAIVTHMLRAGMFVDAAHLLKDESFIKARLASLGTADCARRHVHDCEHFLRLALQDSAVLPNMDPRKVMEMAYHHLCTALTSTHDREKTIEEKRKWAEQVGRAHEAVGRSLAKYRCWKEAIHKWQEGQLLVSAALGEVELVAQMHYYVGAVCFESYQYSKAMLSLHQCYRIRTKCHGDDSPLVGQCFQKMGETLMGMSSFDDALMNFEKALNIYNEHNPRFRVEIGDILHHMGNIHYGRGEVEDALHCFQGAVRSKRLVLGKDCPDLASSFQAIGNCYSDQGNVLNAISQFEEAFRLLSMQQPSEEPEDVADFLLLQGMLHSLKGEEEALDKYERALYILETSVSFRREKIASLLHLIGCVHLVKGENKKSMKRFEESLHARKDGAGFVNLDVANTLYNIAFLHQTRQKYQKALDCLREALKIRKLLSPETERVAFTYQKIANLYMMVNQPRRAEPAFEEALRIRKEMYGDDNLLVASVQQELGNLLDSLGRYDEALEHFDNCLEVRQDQLGPDCDEVAATLYSIGFTLHNLDKNDEAVNYLMQALEVRRDASAHGGSVPTSELGDTLNMIGFLEAKRGNLKESLSFLLEALRIRKMSGDVLKASDTLKNIGNVQREQRKYDVAVKAYDECLRLRRDKLGDEDEKVAGALVAVGNVRSDMGDDVGAIVAYQEALTLRISSLGMSHEKVAELLLTMGTIEFKSGKTKKAMHLLEDYIQIRSNDKDSDYVNALFTIGNIHKIEGRDEEAHQLWAKAYTIFHDLGLEETNPKVSKVMEQLLKASTKKASTTTASTPPTSPAPLQELKSPVIVPTPEDDPAAL